MVKNAFLFIFSYPEIVFSQCFVCLDAEIMLLHLCPFLTEITGIGVSMITK